MHNYGPRSLLRYGQVRVPFTWMERELSTKKLTARPKNWPDSEEAEQLEQEEVQPWTPPRVVDRFTPGRDGVPTIDDDLDRDPHAAPRSYPAWTSETSFVVGGSVGPNGRWKTRREAREWARKKYKVILEEYQGVLKIHFRVNKPKVGQ
jgi:hypothetical protein